MCEAISMFPSLSVAYHYKGYDVNAFIYSILLCFFTGALFSLSKPKNKDIYARDGFAIVAIGWFLVSFFGALPFYLSGAIPSFIDSLFESISGFTTTGSTILQNVEILPKGLLFWRSFTHWIGGMGVLVLTLAILPSAGAKTFYILKAESPGPSPGKLVPKIGQTAKILYGIYFIITTILIILLWIGKMPLYDSFVHAFGATGTGGFSIMNKSIGAYNSTYIDIIITIFMLMCGVNFALYYQLVKGNIKSVLKDNEFQFYIAVVAISIIIITLNINASIFKSLASSLKYASFQVASIISTTGYATTDFGQWPTLSKILLLILMFFGSCAGSTAGGIKSIRILLLFKIIKRELIRIIHPRSIYTVRFNGEAVDEETLYGITSFFFAYIGLFALSILLVSRDGFDIETTISSVAATIGNIGPGFSIVGPMGNFSEMSNLSKIVLSIDMLLGRLEIYPILLLFLPSFWKKVNM